MWRNRTSSSFAGSKYVSLLIDELEQELSDALNIDMAGIASKIREIGFSCQKCGHCCRLAFGDNRVLLTQEDIRDIKEHAGLSKEEIVTPMLPENLSLSLSPGIPDISGIEIDGDGNIHTFGWMLRRRGNGDCSFIGNGDGRQNRCEVYDARPMLCRTYPFYMEDMELQVSECEGLGHRISGSESLKLAQDVVRRYIAEIKDTISLYRNFKDYDTCHGGEGLDIAARRTKEGRIVYIVHDSNGMHRVVERLQR